MFSLHIGEEEKEKVLANVTSNISFSGSNFWILVCAIIIASVGLNVNSTAVVIGAMLISPLMGPIVGAGFALGTYDFGLLRKSLKNLLLSTIIGLVVSFLYFLATPLEEAQSEILARTSPNIFDVIIAFFGGLVGVIAVTRVEKGNPIPGVAIATALMPPLCTAGYGLATGNFTYFGGAFFLYTINCVFICIATFIIVKFLNYPAAAIDRKRANLVRNWIYVVTTLLVIPSIFFAFRLVREQEFQQKINTFIRDNYENKGNTIIYKRTVSGDPKRVELAFLTRRFTAEQIRHENEKLKHFGINNTKLIIRQDSAFIAKVAQDNTNEANTDATKIAAEINSKIERETLNSEELRKELNIFLPEIKNLSVGNIPNDSGRIRVATFEADKVLNLSQRLKLMNWLKIRLKSDSVEVYQKPNNK